MFNIEDLDKALESSLASLFGTSETEERIPDTQYEVQTCQETIFSTDEYRQAMQYRALPKYANHLKEHQKAHSPEYSRCMELSEDMIRVWLLRENTREWFLSNQDILLPAIEHYIYEHNKSLLIYKMVALELLEMQEEDNDLVELLQQVRKFYLTGEVPADAPVSRKDDNPNQRVLIDAVNWIITSDPCFYEDEDEWNNCLSMVEDPVPMTKNDFRYNRALWDTAIEKYLADLKFRNTMAQDAVQRKGRLSVEAIAHYEQELNKTKEDLQTLAHIQEMLNDSSVSDDTLIY